MTSISYSMAPAETRAARNIAFDRARTFITVLVLIYHSILPYTYYGRADRQSFIGFDGVELFCDNFFMAAMFFISGLFVWPGLRRKGAASFLRDRWLRLGLPFVICALVVMPIAYYAIDLRLHGDRSLIAFWWKTIVLGPRPGGPAWFIWVLLAFDTFAAMAYLAAPALVEAFGRLSVAGFARPGLFFRALLIGSIVAYFPLALYFGDSRWIAISPFVVQVSRILLYLLYFLAGVVVGTVSFDQGLLARDGEMARRWAAWTAAAICSFGCIVALFYVRHNLLPDPNYPALWWRVAYALAFVCYCAAQTFNLLALFIRFGNGGSNFLDAMRNDAYGIYLIHYLPVLWLQYLLLGISLSPVMPWTAILKAIIVFALTLAVSWAATALLRKIPGAARVL